MQNSNTFRKTHRRKLCDLGVRQEILGHDVKCRYNPWRKKTKQNDKLFFIKSKSFCSGKDNIKRLWKKKKSKKLPTEKKYFQITYLTKALIFRIYKELSNSTVGKQTTIFKNWQKTLTLYQEEIRTFVMGRIISTLLLLPKMSPKPMNILCYVETGN